MMELNTAGVEIFPRARSAAPKRIALPAPHLESGRPLITTLRLRRSTRTYSNQRLRPQILSDLLWCAIGVNRPNGDRTVPHWGDTIVIDIYAAMADGVWLYEPDQHRLSLRHRCDIRAMTGPQDFVASAPLNLIYVAHGERMRELTAEERRLRASVDTGFIGQNVYLFCASEGLGTVFRGAVDCRSVARALDLSAGEFVTAAQTVGYPARTTMRRLRPPESSEDRSPTHQGNPS